MAAKFEFTLSRMLSYKEQIQEAEKTKLAELNIVKNGILTRIDEVKVAYHNLSFEMAEAQKKGMSLTELKNYNFQMQNSREYTKQLNQELLHSQIAVDKQLEVLILATQEVEGLNKLKEKQYEDFLYEENKKEELVVSEFVSAKFIRDAAEN